MFRCVPSRLQKIRASEGSVAKGSASETKSVLTIACAPLDPTIVAFAGFYEPTIGPQQTWKHKPNIKNMVLARRGFFQEGRMLNPLRLIKNSAQESYIAVPYYWEVMAQLMGGG